MKICFQFESEICFGDIKPSESGLDAAACEDNSSESKDSATG